MLKDRIISYLPVNFLLGCCPLPEGYYLVNGGLCCMNSSGFSGALVRNQHTGIYMLCSSGILASIDQRFAAFLETEGYSFG